MKAIAVVATAAILAGGVAFADGKRAEAVATASGNYDTALSKVRSARAGAVNDIATATAAVATAKELVAGSAGKVLDNKARMALDSEIRRATAKIGVAGQELEQTASSVKALKPEPTLFGESYDVSARALTKYRFVSASRLTEVATPLAAAQKNVSAAVVAWQVEQKRLAAVAAAKAAAAKAAREAAARAAAAVSASYSPGSPSQSVASTGSVFTKYVWTSGFQSEINRCRGAVNVTGRYGARTIAEHWSCGGRAFPTRAGSIVRLTGVVSGTYRVIGIVKVLSASRDSIGDVPRGYDMLYQTCMGGSSERMSFTAMRRIG